MKSGDGGCSRITPEFERGHEHRCSAGLGFNGKCSEGDEDGADGVTACFCVGNKEMVGMRGLGCDDANYRPVL